MNTCLLKLFAIFQYFQKFCFQFAKEFKRFFKRYCEIPPVRRVLPNIRSLVEEVEKCNNIILVSGCILGQNKNFFDLFLKSLCETKKLLQHYTENPEYINTTKTTFLPIETQKSFFDPADFLEGLKIFYNLKKCDLLIFFETKINFPWYLFFFKNSNCPIVVINNKNVTINRIQTMFGASNFLAICDNPTMFILQNFPTVKSQAC